MEDPSCFYQLQYQLVPIKLNLATMFLKFASKYLTLGWGHNVSQNFHSNLLLRRIVDPESSKAAVAYAKLNFRTKKTRPGKD